MASEPERTIHPAVAASRRFAMYFVLWLVIAGQEALPVGALAAGLATEGANSPSTSTVSMSSRRRTARSPGKKAGSASVAGAMRNLRLPHFSSAVPDRFIGFVERRSEQWSVVGPVLLIIVLIGAALL